MLPGAATYGYFSERGDWSTRFSWIPTSVGKTVAICDTLRGKDGCDMR